MDPHAPPVQQGGDTVDPRRERRGRLRAGAHHPWPVDRPESGEPWVGRPAVRDDRRSRDDRALHEADPTLCRRVGTRVEPATTTPSPLALSRLTEDKLLSAHLGSNGKGHKA